ncbi:unnamed protein product [Meloidogyne enterolobii]|uniref:Uncharacterized protein n=1 Tax=Meloidogyne enterolobii TaxID=390850 RepID=A0ACB0YYD8_MELEN
MAINRKFKLGMTPSPSPAERISNFKQVTKPSTSNENILIQGKRARRNSRVCGLAIGSNPLGCVPLHHRTLSTRRRFSAYASISPPPLLNRWGENFVVDERKGKEEEEEEEGENAGINEKKVEEEKEV